MAVLEVSPCFPHPVPLSQISKVRALCTSTEQLLAAADVSSVPGAGQLIDDVSVDIHLSRCLTPLNSSLPMFKV